MGKARGKGDRGRAGEAAAAADGAGREAARRRPAPRSGGRQGRPGPGVSGAPRPGGTAAGGLREERAGAARLVLVLFFLPDELFLLPSFSVRKTKRVPQGVACHVSNEA